MSVRRRWIVAAASFALILIVATFPMRLALSLAGAGDAGIAAREVRGSIWSGALIDDVNGTTSLSGGLGMVPVDTIRFEGAAVRFDDAGQCVAAAGRLQLMVNAPLAGLDLSRGLSGPLTCANGRAQAALASQSGMERLTLSFDGKGAYRGQFAINVDRDPAMAAALTVLGFKPGSSGYVLTTMGRF